MSLCKILKDKFRTNVDKTILSPLPPLEHIVDEDEQEEDEVLLSHHTYQYVFEDHNHGEEKIINLQSVLRMRLERKELAWSEL